MDNFLAFLVGAIAGILYTEHIYLQSRIFPRRSPLLNFWVRFAAIAVSGIYILKGFGLEGFFLFCSGFILFLFLNTLRRGIRIQ